jgi:hypothetical protein
MVYNSNGGFNWSDLYFMPTKLREFYFNQLLKAKNIEKESYEKINKNVRSKSTPSKTIRK